MPKLGIVVEQDTLDWLEEPLGYGDSRSERIRNSLDVSQAAEQAMIDSGFVDPHDKDLEEIVYTAVSEWAQDNPQMPDGGSKSKPKTEA